jgi:hypothetical protein
MLCGYFKEIVMLSMPKHYRNVLRQAQHDKATKNYLVIPSSENKNAQRKETSFK